MTKPRLYRLADGTLASVEDTGAGTLIIRTPSRTIVVRKGSL